MTTYLFSGFSRQDHSANFDVILEGPDIVSCDMQTLSEKSLNFPDTCNNCNLLAIAIARSCIRSGARGWAGIRIVDDGAYYSFPIWPENELLMADRGAQRDVMITATAPQGFEIVHPIGTGRRPGSPRWAARFNKSGRPAGATLTQQHAGRDSAKNRATGVPEIGKRRAMRPPPLAIRASAHVEQRVKGPLAIRDRRRNERRVAASSQENTAARILFRAGCALASQNRA